jgi:hypothetical protein
MVMRGYTKLMKNISSLWNQHIQCLSTEITSVTEKYVFISHIFCFISFAVNICFNPCIIYVTTIIHIHPLGENPVTIQKRSDIKKTRR